MKKLELVKAFNMEQENEYVRAYRQTFPDARPTIFQLELIEGTVDDLRAWRKTLIWWAGNDYRAQSVFKMLEYYKQVKAGTVQTFAKEVKRDRVGAAENYPEDFGEPPPPCRFCKTEWCFKDHREDILREGAA